MREMASSCVMLFFFFLHKLKYDKRFLLFFYLWGYGVFFVFFFVSCLPQLYNQYLPLAGLGARDLLWVLFFFFFLSFLFFFFGGGGAYP